MTLDIQYLRPIQSRPYYLTAAVHTIREQLEDRTDINFDELTAVVKSTLDQQRFIVRNLRCTGKDIPREVNAADQSITIFALHSKTRYVRFSLVD